MKTLVIRLPLLTVWLLIAAIAVTLAYWTWRLMPLPAGTDGFRADHAVRFDLANLKAQNWFAAPAGARVASNSRYQLRWLYPGRPGVCILALPGLHDQAFRVGEEVEPGVTLKEVDADHILLSDPAGIERIDLPKDSGTPPAGLISPAGRNTGTR